MSLSLVSMNRAGTEMEIPFGLLLVGGVIVIVIGFILLIVLGLLYIAYERVFAYAAMFLGLALAAWIIVSFMPVPINIPFLSPPTTPVPVATPVVSEQDILRSLASYGAGIELLNLTITESNVVELEYEFISSKPVANEEIKIRAAHKVICALRKHTGKPISYTMKLIGQARHEDPLFGINTTKPAGELQFSDNLANSVNCSL